jgi:hypothetical protein
MRKRPRNQERSFGILVGGAFLGIGAILLWRGRETAAAIAGATGLALVLLGLVRPSLLRGPNRWWSRFAHALAYVNARLLLTLLFVTVLIPVSMVWRLLRKDPLMRRRDQWSGWAAYPARYRDRNHYRQMY